MNVIAFPVSVFSHLDAGRDGSYVLFSYAGNPVEAIGPFNNAAEARAWAAETGTKEKIKVDWATFPDGGVA